MMRRNLSLASADEIKQMSIVKNAQKKLKEFKTVINRYSIKRYIQKEYENIFSQIS